MATNKLSKIKTTVLFFAVLFTVLIICLVILETTIRVFLPQDMNIYMYDSDFVFKFQPKATIHMKTHEYNVKTTFNEDGFRGRICYAKPRDVFRVLLLGDSFTSGLEVEFDKTWGYLLEKKLDVEVINTGVNGWSTEQQLLFLKRYGKKFDPDLVILAYYIGNDQTDNVLRNLFLFDGENITVNRNRSFAQSRLRSVYYTLSAYSHFFNFIWRNYSTIKAKLRGNKQVISLDPDYFINTYLKIPETEDSEYAWSKTNVLVREMKQFLDEREVSLLIVAIHDPVQLRVEEREDIDKQLPQKKLSEIAEELSIAYLDLMPYYEGQEDAHFDMDFHWNDKGHKIAANAITKKLINEKLIPIDND